jgi:hypothetical protein
MKLAALLIIIENIAKPMNILWTDLISM